MVKKDGPKGAQAPKQSVEAGLAARVTELENDLLRMANLLKDQMGGPLGDLAVEIASKKQGAVV